MDGINGAEGKKAADGSGEDVLLFHRALPPV